MGGRHRSASVLDQLFERKSIERKRYQQASGKTMRKMRDKEEIFATARFLSEQIGAPSPEHSSSPLI
jgi:membrane carboxypeptidase/penicillin-binding protein